MPISARGKRTTTPARREEYNAELRRLVTRTAACQAMKTYFPYQPREETPGATSYIR
jgi:hypothetical protein